MEILSKQIQLLRRERGWTQAQLAREMGVSRSLVSAWELQTRSLFASNIVKLGKLFNVSLDWLLGMSNVRERKTSKK